MDTSQDIISRTVYVHNPVNPPSIGHGVDAKIKLVNPKHLSIENWQEGEQPTFTLKIADPKAMGLLNFQDNSVERFIDDLILSCNLVLKRAAFSKNNLDSTHSTVERKQEPKPKPKVENTPSGTEITVTEVVYGTDHFHFTIGFEDELDESKTLELLSKILSIKNGMGQTTLKVNDLQKSLNEYQSAMFSFEGLGIFKHLFSSLGISTNCDGNDRIGQALVQESALISGIDLSKIDDCRSFNGRVKHIDRNPQEEKEYQEGLKKLEQKITCLREAIQKIITYRLKSII